jgi:hypothetical protein
MQSRKLTAAAADLAAEVRKVSISCRFATMAREVVPLVDLLGSPWALSFLGGHRIALPARNFGYSTESNLLESTVLRQTILLASTHVVFPSFSFRIQQPRNLRCSPQPALA